MFHDLGKLVLDTYFHEEFTRVVSLVKGKGILIRDAEEQVLGFDHAEVGSIVADRWNLPPTLIKAIRFHHNPSLAHGSMRMVAIVHLADVFCRALSIGNGGDDKIPCINEGPWKIVDLNRITIKKLFLEMEREIANSKTLLSFIK